MYLNGQVDGKWNTELVNVTTTTVTPESRAETTTTTTTATDEPVQDNGVSNSQSLVNNPITEISVINYEEVTTVTVEQVEQIVPIGRYMMCVLLLNLFALLCIGLAIINIYTILMAKTSKGDDQDKRPSSRRGCWANFTDCYVPGDDVSIV